MALRTACVLNCPSRSHLAPEIREDLLELDHLAMESALFDRLTSAVAVAKRVLDAARATRAQEQQAKESRS